jgi:feruloyl esterase
MSFFRVTIGAAGSAALATVAFSVMVDGQQGRGPAPAPAQTTAPLQALLPNQTPTRSCESLKTLSLPNVVIENVTSDPGGLNGAAFCSVTATVTHPPAGDKETVWIGLPLANWNGRFEGVGGGGFSGGSAMGIRQPVSQGFAAGSTDTGHTGASGSFALDSTGHLDWPRIRDNAYLGVHDMTTVGQTLVREFYGAPPRRSYFNGCSTGGRQGLSEAQRYPADYDGILAGAPAINWTRLHIEQLWGGLTMNEAHNPVPVCKFQAATQAAIDACDAIDGVKDGVIDDPKKCTYDPKALVGTSTACGTFTQADADVIAAIWGGPRRRDGSFLWYGLPRGADFTGLSGTGGSPLEPRPNPITLEWWRFFLNQNPSWDWKTVTRASYEQYWDQSLEEFSAVLATDNPDLTAFRDRGGRIVMWHGQADQLIYPEGSIDYYTRVETRMGGPQPTRQFVRLFLAPGVGHCGGGAGPAPSGQFESMVHWVEDGRAPDTLDAIRRDQSGQVVRSRPLCPYPMAAGYKGQGSTDVASNFDCAVR